MDREGRKISLNVLPQDFNIIEAVESDNEHINGWGINSEELLISWTKRTKILHGSTKQQLTILTNVNNVLVLLNIVSGALASGLSFLNLRNSVCYQDNRYSIAIGCMALIATILTGIQISFKLKDRTENAKKGIRKLSKLVFKMESIQNTDPEYRQRADEVIRELTQRYEKYQELCSVPDEKLSTPLNHWFVSHANQIHQRGSIVRKSVRYSKRVPSEPESYNHTPLNLLAFNKKNSCEIDINGGSDSTRRNDLV